MGVPTIFRSDGGSQYSSREFQDFLKKWFVTWRPSSPYFAQSNGLAESSVKALKALLLKLGTPSTKSPEFKKALLEFRNTPRSDGRSPNEVVYGRQLRSCIPTHHTAFDPKWIKAMDAADKKKSDIAKKVEQHYNATANDLAPIPIGTKVRVFDPQLKRWSRKAVIVAIGRGSRSAHAHREYKILFPSGRSSWRNRRHIRPLHAGDEDDAEGEMANTRSPDVIKTDEVKDEQEIRRSSRVKKPPVRFGTDTVVTIDRLPKYRGKRAKELNKK